MAWEVAEGLQTSNMQSLSANMHGHVKLVKQGIWPWTKVSIRWKSFHTIPKAEEIVKAAISCEQSGCLPNSSFCGADLESTPSEWHVRIASDWKDGSWFDLHGHECHLGLQPFHAAWPFRRRFLRNGEEPLLSGTSVWEVIRPKLHQLGNGAVWSVSVQQTTPSLCATCFLSPNDTRACSSAMHVICWSGTHLPNRWNGASGDGSVGLAFQLLCPNLSYPSPLRSLVAAGMVAVPIESV